MLGSKRIAFLSFVMLLLPIFAMGQGKSLSTSLPFLPHKDVFSITRWAVSSASLYDNRPRNTSLGTYRRIVSQRGHSTETHETGIVSIGAGTFSPQPLHRTTKSHLSELGILNAIGRA